MTKLHGIKVLDLSMFLPGPYLGMIMADHGADVIKVEPPQGDPGREIGVETTEGPSLHRNVNRGKKSLQLDLKSDDGKAIFLQKAQQADVIIESFRPGVAARLGVSYDDISAFNPQVVYVSLSAFGQEGPYQHKPAHDLATMALAGGLTGTVGFDGFPVMPGIAVADMLASLNGLSAVLMALIRRQQTGQGDYIDISMQHSVMAALPNVSGWAQVGEPDPDWKHARTTGGAALYNIYCSADDKWFVLGAQELKFARNLLQDMDLMEHYDACTKGPGPHQQELICLLREKFSKKPRDYWLKRFEKLDISIAPINSIGEALNDANLRALHAVQEDETGYIQVMPVARFRCEPSQPNLCPPALAPLNSDEGLWQQSKDPKN